MAPSTTFFSSSGRVEYAVTNHVAFFEKESVHADFHPLMDFLNNSPASYALTASPTIYAEVVEEMWNTACCSMGQIKLKIKGKSYSITPSVELWIKDKDDTLQVFVQSKVLFSNLVKNGFHDEVKFVLPKHIRVQLSTLSSSPSHIAASPIADVIDEVKKDPLSPTQVKLPSQSQSETKTTSSACGKRKNTTLPTIAVDGNEENESAMDENPPQKKIKTSIVKPELRLFSEDPEMPPGFFRNGVPEMRPLPLEEENPKCDLRFVLEPTLNPFSDEKMLPEDRQHLVNAASVLKSQLLARLTSDANKLSTEDRITLANRCYYALRELGDDYKSFRSKVDKLIEHYEELEIVDRKKQNFNDQLSRAEDKLSDVTKKSSDAENKLFEAETNVGNMKFKREELTGALLKLKEELYEEEERVKILTTEWDLCEEAKSDAKAELGKLYQEKRAACVAFKAINDQYNTAKKECERLSSQLLQLARK
ncbi:hypothetical protein POM88_034744 [Heracleum sosnowskyi]|uniref:Uncharacterized protein n=1 Tax=Heracleum sosnowskyi TaxID=360622 RepID=A0AAD8HM00_9APIA|nr:hypothetical protein POM88_034744 [Heracleum sosnowskyi]